jgi:hypothetical protein
MEIKNIKNIELALMHFCMLRHMWIVSDLLIKNIEVIKSRYHKGDVHIIRQEDGKAAKIELDWVLDDNIFSHSKITSVHIARYQHPGYLPILVGDLQMNAKCMTLDIMQNHIIGFNLINMCKNNRVDPSLFIFIKMARNIIIHHNGNINDYYNKKLKSKREVKFEWKDLLIADKLGDLSLGRVDLLLLLEDSIKILADLVVKSGRDINKNSVKLAYDLLAPNSHVS